jgi:electron transfer flavoprotein alpha subunit
MSKILGIAFSSSDAAGIQAFAAAVGAPFDLVCFGSGVTDAGAGAVHLIPGELPNADVLAETVKSVASGYTHFAAVSSMASKDVSARLAGILDCGMVTDVIAASSPTVFHRPVVAGTVIATVEVDATPVVLTFRPAGFAPQSPAGSSPVHELTTVGSSRATKRPQAAKQASRPDLTQAKIIVSGGRPLKDAETFERVIGGFADALGGAAGATRAAVDSGIAANELQVGQTGKIVAPDLYIAAGISGSTQHMAGIKDSKIIVAINKDGDAPIFDMADLGLVADLYEALPAILAKLGK